MHFFSSVTCRQSLLTKHDLHKHLSNIVDHLDAERVSTILISKEILPWEWKDSVEQPKRRRQEREAILKVVIDKGQDGLNAFMEALIEVKQSHLVRNN